jgi:hypothetical protein
VSYLLAEDRPCGERVGADGRDEEADWPELRLMTSTGVPASSAPGNEQAREPKGDEVSTYLASQQTDADFRSCSSSHPRL